MRACINGNWLAYDDIGYGPAVILIHSFPLSRQMWQSQTAALSAEGFRVIVPDLRGFGESELRDERFDLATLADDVSGLMNYLGLGRAVLVGISSACGLLIDMLERYPQRVAASCFLSPAMRPGEATEQIRRLELAEMVRQGYRSTVIDKLCERLLCGNPKTVRRVLTDRLSGWMKGASPVALAGFLEALPRRLACPGGNQSYPVPTLVVSGARDRVLPVPRQSGPANGIWRVVKDAGSLLNLEAPDEINRLLLDFLQQLNTIKLHHHRLQKVA